MYVSVSSKCFIVNDKYFNAANAALFRKHFLFVILRISLTRVSSNRYVLGCSRLVLDISKKPEVLRQISVSREKQKVKQLQALSQLSEGEDVRSIMEQGAVLGGKKNKASFWECISSATRRLLTIEGNLSDDVGKFLLTML